MIKVSGKCKEDFKQYLIETGVLRKITSYDEFWMFYKLPESVKYTLLVGFFDSVGIWVNIDSDMSDASSEIYDLFHYEINGVGIWESSRGEEELFKTRCEAQTKVMEKANDIYNGQV